MYALKIPGVRGLFATMPQVKLRSSSLQSMFPQFTRFNPCSPSKICKMASDLCRVASKFCLNILHSSSSAPRQLPPGFSTSHTLDFGLRTDHAAAECLVFFAQFPETLCLSPSMIAFCSPRDQVHCPLKPNHPRACDFVALGDAQTSSWCPKRSEGISLHSIQRATTTIWWLPPQRLPFSESPQPPSLARKDVYLTIVLKIIRRIEYPKWYIHSTNCHHLGLTWHPQRRLHGQLNAASPWIPDTLFFPSQPVKATAREEGELTPLVHLDGLCCVLTSNFGNDVLWPPPPGLERQYKMSYSNQKMM
ncbi:hypothetical protein DFH08DRAFT_937466 [Mycena albidolilacea]|uniref:Uncharacterized protein n=1 Tax=Mycena albidolilacea TaxID=1033008 RepID=A0AAD6ZYN9_9AGAR|nr:hypothetical protein DFH08DRAFT_937466 [Mycena albidolilacea]